jgi:hypothetical protein
VDPARSVQGDPIDIEDILIEVLGEEAELLARVEDRKVVSYATTEKDLMETEGEDFEGEESEETDFEGGGEE